MEEKSDRASQQLKSAYIFAAPTIKTSENVGVTPTPHPKLEKPYQLTLQSGIENLPLVGIFHSPQPISPTDSALIEMENGNFGVKVRSGENRLDDGGGDGEEAFEFRPYRHKPLRVRSSLRKKSNSETSKEENDEKEV